MGKNKDRLNQKSIPWAEDILSQVMNLPPAGGEDLQGTAEAQGIAVTELLKMVSRKVADHKGEGAYVWKKLTAKGGEFIDFVVSADTGAYPNGGTQDGYWYDLLSQPVDLASEPDLIANNIREGVDIFGVIGAMSEGVSGVDFGTVTITTKKMYIDVNHKLEVIPSFVALLPKKFSDVGTVNLSQQITYPVNAGGTDYKFFSYNSKSGFLASYKPTLNANTVRFMADDAYYLSPGTYQWVVFA